MTPLKSEYFGAFLAFAKDEEIGLALVVIPGGHGGERSRASDSLHDQN